MNLSSKKFWEVKSAIRKKRRGCDRGPWIGYTVNGTFFSKGSKTGTMPVIGDKKNCRIFKMGVTICRVQNGFYLSIDFFVNGWKKSIVLMRCFVIPAYQFITRRNFPAESS